MFELVYWEKQLYWFLIYADMLERSFESLIFHESERYRRQLIFRRKFITISKDEISVRQRLDNNYLNDWIERGGTVKWPSRSPDPSPLDFFLWVHLKSIVFETKPGTIEQLKEQIFQTCRAISTESFAIVRQESIKIESIIVLRTTEIIFNI